jgi:hypothetical protein
MAAYQDCTPAPLTGPGILARLAPVDGTGSGLDADTVRGRAPLTDVFRFDVAPAFIPPPLYAETQGVYLFGI